MQRPLSVLHGLDQEVLKILIPLHCEAAEPRILDVTYNKGVMWRGLDYKPVRMDIDPTYGLDLVGDFCDIPVEDKSFDIIIFDPPHLPSDIGVTSLFNTKYNTDKFDEGRKKDNINGLFEPFLNEAKRVLVPGGIVLAKIADIVHNHKMQWHHVHFITECWKAGITACDMLIKRDPKAGNLKSSKWKNVKHLRKAHSYWIVVRNSNRCEKKC